MIPARVVAIIGVVAAASACDAITSIALAGADFGGATADAHCDRRFVTEGGIPSAFCQEIVGTVAASQFSDDCRYKLLATPGTGLCPRERIVAGCKLDESNDDHSTVRDWYYDVSGFPPGPDGGLEFAPPVDLDASAVSVTCADRSRYEAGAELIFP